jgi:predicted ATP-grasp superfamily ATP-dependent carboligase
MKINHSILFVGGGRRLELARLFEKAGIAVVAYESEENSPISAYFPAIKGLSWKDPDLVTDIAATVVKYKIPYILPLQDEAAYVLSGSVVRNILISSNKETNEICYDKLKFNNFILDNFPSLYPYPRKQYPIIYKPRFGFGSNGIVIIKDYKDEYKITDELIKNSVYHQFINGQEWTCDTYVDKQGKCIGVVPRRRIRVAGGEVMTAKIEHQPELMALTRDVVLKLDICGPACVQFIVEKDTGHPYIMECNARFGGGSTLSCFAGFDLVEMIYREYYLEEKLNSQDYGWRPNVLMNRSYEDNFFYLD